MPAKSFSYYDSILVGEVPIKISNIEYRGRARRDAALQFRTRENERFLNAKTSYQKEQPSRWPAKTWDRNDEARPAKAISRLGLMPLLTPQVHPGPLYRCGKSAEQQPVGYGGGGKRAGPTIRPQNDVRILAGRRVGLLGAV